MSAAEIVLFESSDGEVTLPVEVDAAKNEVWLTQDQMAMLFDTTKQNVSKHTGNAIREGEIDPKATVNDSLTVQLEGNREVNRRVRRYSLDVIISVGYRVKSLRGVEFRRWANEVLRRYLTDGYVVNEHRLRELGRVASIINRLPEGDVSVRQIVDIVQSYSQALDLLDDYDHQVVSKPEGRGDAYVLSYEECREVIDGMRFGSESNLFGVEKDDSFHASIGDIYAGFAGQEAYPTVEEKAANLLDFVVKNHSFLDGNKRIAAVLFLHFLDRNGLLFDKRGNKLLEDGVLVALTIMMAESRPQEKEIMVNLTMNFLCR